MSEMDRSRDFLNGPKVAAWFRERGLTSPREQLGELRRNFYHWEGGRQATVWAVDEVLVQLGWSPDLDQFPEEFWEPPINRKAKPPATRWLATALLREGKTVMQVARGLGVSPESVRRWRDKHGVS